MPVFAQFEAWRVNLACRIVVRLNRVDHRITAMACSKSACSPIQGIVTAGATFLAAINSAIASTTGVYQGYGFAIPINLARRIMEDQEAIEERQRGRVEMRRIREERKSEERPTVSGRDLLLAREEISARAPGGVEGEEKEKWVQKEWKQLLDQSYD